jgi:hypothetical protein
MAIGEVAVMTDAMEAVRENVQQKPPDELARVERHHFALVVMSIILPQEAHSTVGHVNETAVGDGNSMSIAAEILEDLRGTAKRTLGIDNPGRLAQRL